jgi:sialidase-1
VEKPTGQPTKQLRLDLALSLLHLLFALLLCVVFIVFLTAFGGEFLIVVKGSWILPIFLGLLVGGAIGVLALTVAGLRSGARRDFPPDAGWPILARTSWLIGWALWDLCAVVPIILVGKVLALGALGSVPGILIGVLVLPFAGIAALLTAGSVKSLVGFFRDRGSARLIRGAVASGLAFLWVFAAFGVLAARWNPRWTEGVEHMPLFVAGEEPGRSYRIPAMIVLPGDVLLAFAESRVNAMSDLLDINLVLKRSLDGGRTWSDLQVLQDIGRHTVHSPCPVLDSETQTVWLPYCIDYSTLYMVHSQDAGLTWSEPRDLSQELGLPEGMWCHNGPGNGVQLVSGRLVIPTSLDVSRVLYSDNHGSTWHLGEPIGRGGEPQVFERADGALCANLRNERGANRIVACSEDGGETWGPWSYDEGLPDAGTQASILRFTLQEAGSHSRLLFSNPGAPYRGELTLRLSYDEGATWEASRTVYEGAAGYSQLAVLSDHTILALFETGRFDLRESITLIRTTLDWLTGGDPLPSS